MILVLFFGMTAVLAMSAVMAGGIDYFFNLDSLLIILAAFVLGAAAAGCRNWKALGLGFRQLAEFGPKTAKDPETASIFLALAVIVAGAGVVSTVQGVIAGMLINPGAPLSGILPYAFFTTLYGLILALFLLWPVAARNR